MTSGGFGNTFDSAKSRYNRLNRDAYMLEINVQVTLGTGALPFTVDLPATLTRPGGGVGDTNLSCMFYNTGGGLLYSVIGLIPAAGTSVIMQNSGTYPATADGEITCNGTVASK